MATQLKLERVQDYLNSAVEHWNTKRLEASRVQNLNEEIKSSIFQDAYQAIRGTICSNLPEKTVSIRSEKVEDYLDKGIRAWRVKQVQAQTLEEQSRAIWYQDAFQTTRQTLLGRMLPVD